MNNALIAVCDVYKNLTSLIQNVVSHVIAMVCNGLLKTQAALQRNFVSSGTPSHLKPFDFKLYHLISVIVVVAVIVLFVFASAAPMTGGTGAFHEER